MPTQPNINSARITGTTLDGVITLSSTTITTSSITTNSLFGTTVSATTFASTSLTGTTTQMVVANASGILSVQPFIGFSNLVTVTGTGQTMSSNILYVANNATGVTFTLPVSSNYGDMLRVSGLGVGKWRINQNAGQIIKIAGNTTTLGVSGGISATTQYDVVTLMCLSANTLWSTQTLVGTLTIN